MARVLHSGFPIIRNILKPNLLTVNEAKTPCRQYARNTLGRTPIRVIMPGEDENDDSEWQAKKALKERKTQEKNIGVPHYEKLQEHSTVFTNMIADAKSKKGREKTGRVLLEGKRLIRDALEAGVLVDNIFFSREENLIGLDLAKIPNLKLRKIMYKQLSLWSNLTTAPGIMGVFDLRNLEIKTRPALPLTVICDNVREPGNLGSILRCAVAVGCKQVLLTKGCVDPWEPKVMRSGCGAHFRAHVEADVGWESVCNHVSDDAAVYLASNKCAVESDDVETRYFKKPILYEVGEDGKKVQTVYENINESVEEDDEEESRLFPTGTTAVYHDVRYVDDEEMVVIVGGETEGLSPAAHKFTLDRSGQSIFIPLENNVESLNSGIALGVILFEIQRQWSRKQKSSPQ